MSTIQRQEEVRFRDHIRRLSVRSFPSNSDGFDDELTELGKIDQRVRSNLDEFYTGSLGSSMAKNRFDDVKPNEQTLVRLRPISKRGDGTYINANYIDAREAMEVPFVYIATQAPMQNTVLDFWRMVYENDVAFIVMLCSVKENGKVKSETYWPAPGQVYDLGLLSIATLSENARSDSVHRTLLLRTVRGDEKEVYHMQYLAWPDQGIPTTSIPLMEMIQAIGKSRRSVESPIVVHCSGGIGRTGVFIGMHIALAQFQLERTSISMLRIVRFMKLCRSGMVQRKDQYMFLYYSVQREMERMILSAEKGVNLLDIRARDKPIPAPAPASPGTRPRLLGRPTGNGFFTAAPVHPMPAGNHSIWSRATLTNLLRSTSPDARHRRRGQQGLFTDIGQHIGREVESDGYAPSQPRRRRDVVADMAAMSDYLRRNPSMRAHAEVPPEASRPGRREQRGSRRSPRDRARVNDDEGEEYEDFSESTKENGEYHDNRPAPPPRGRQPEPPNPYGHHNSAAQTKLAAELLRIQSLNRIMRFSASTTNRAAGEERSSPERGIATTPLSITREPPRTPESTPRHRAALTARERSPPPFEDDLAFLQRRVATRGGWRRR